jgi:hypothetical protein
MHPTGMKALLWTLQITVAVILLVSGYTKLFLPHEQVAEAAEWTGAYTEVFVRYIGMIDILGGLGLILPGLLAIYPRITGYTAIGIAVLMIAAMVLHIDRYEFGAIWVNIFILIASVIIAYGRLWHASTSAPRRHATPL